MSNGDGVPRGDRNRSARLVQLRSMVPVCNAIIGIDLADHKHMVVVCDHDSKVLARRTFRCTAWGLGAALDRAAERAVAKGFAGVPVAPDVIPLASVETAGRPSPARQDHGADVGQSCATLPFTPPMQPWRDPA